jgi:hypothetical protein
MVAKEGTLKSAAVKQNAVAFMMLSVVTRGSRLK